MTDVNIYTEYFTEIFRTSEKAIYSKTMALSNCSLYATNRLLAIHETLIAVTSDHTNQELFLLTWTGGVELGTE